jgi:hypothetical protein
MGGEFARSLCRRAARTHRSLNKDAPVSRPVQRIGSSFPSPDRGSLQSFGGHVLIRRCLRVNWTAFLEVIGCMSDLPLSLVLGIGLAAATGFRIFLPMLIMSGAAYTGHLSLDDNFAWLGTPSALTMLSVAALAEVLAYYVPGVDNLLDSLATPAALIAGTIVSAAVMTDLPPMVKWTAAVIAGGGVASLTQGVTAILRAKSTVLTGGLGNLVIATAELGGALLVSLLALAAPLAALALVILFLWLAIRLLRQLFRGVRSSNGQK